ncbi:hypothetical protein [Brevundimonas sp. LjRoot202]|uniref:hypothetical protein n=1 Tax=Brevundimonas sp. LjRoot202 TaxID=3342281 RepID=UPI003ED0AC30
MADELETVEDAAATLLNGVMITLLGAALPALFVWQAIRQWGSWTLDPSWATFADAAPLVFLSIFSLQFVRCGIGLARRGGSALVRRRPPAAGAD